jgi:hypothetical protein
MKEEWGQPLNRDKKLQLLVTIQGLTPLPPPVMQGQSRIRFDRVRWRAGDAWERNFNLAIQCSGGYSFDRQGRMEL